MSEFDHDPCCSSHGVPMSCEDYRRTHFCEVRPCCGIDVERLKDEIVLGQRVRFTRPLRRISTHLEGVRGRYGKIWVPLPVIGKPVEQEGIVVGKRTLANGENGWWEEEVGTVFYPKERFTAFLIAFDLRRKPVFVRPEDVTVVSR
jgi:hypothetical protein